MEDVPGTDWGTDFQLQGWVGPKHVGSDTPAPPSPGIPASASISAGKAWLCHERPRSFPPTLLPSESKAHGRDVQMGRKHLTGGGALQKEWRPVLMLCGPLISTTTMPIVPCPCSASSQTCSVSQLPASLLRAPPREYFLVFSEKTQHIH